MTLLRAKRLAGVLLTLAMAGAFAAPAQPKRVLILHSFSSGYFVNGLRTELNRQLPGRVDFYEHWLVSARFGGQGEDAAFADYLNGLFATHPLDLIITLGGPAANFIQRYQQRRFASTPLLLTDVEERRLTTFSLAANETVVASTID